MKLRSIAYKYYYSFKGYKIFSSIFSKRDICDLKQLASNKNIIVCKPDKGRGVVLIDRVTYTNKMINIVNDTSKFIKLTESIRTIDKINNYLRKLKNLDLLSAETYKQLCSTGSGPGILYGLPKIHKPNFSTSFQFRPIFAAYNTTTPHLITLLNISCLYYLI